MERGGMGWIYTPVSICDLAHPSFGLGQLNISDFNFCWQVMLNFQEEMAPFQVAQSSSLYSPQCKMISVLLTQCCPVLVLCRDSAHQLHNYLLIPINMNKEMNKMVCWD